MERKCGGHGDLIRGNGEIPRERCRVCHNRKEDIARIDDHVFMHRNRVTDHKIDCLDCHLEIVHSLDREKIAHAAATFRRRLVARSTPSLVSGQATA